MGEEEDNWVKLKASFTQEFDMTSGLIHKGEELVQIVLERDGGGA